MSLLSTSLYSKIKELIPGDFDTLARLLPERRNLEKRNEVELDFMIHFS